MHGMRAAVRETQNVDFGSQWQGQTVDRRFPLRQYLGGGAHTAVYLTELDDHEKTKAAIKLLAASAIKPEEQLAAWHEAAKLAHPHLIRILEYGRCWLSSNELLYVVFEYAEENLGQVLPTRALSSEEAVGLLRPALDALGYLHTRKLVHAHISPANLLAVDDHLKLSSDGIQASGTQKTRTEASPYDAPELGSGQLTAAADVWSLGVTLVHALTQRVPRTDKPVDANLPQPFADIVRHSLRPDPASRWTVADISARLQGKPVAERVAESAPVTSTQAAVTNLRRIAQAAPDREDPSSGSRKHVLYWVGAAVVVLILAGYLALRRHPIQLQPSDVDNAASSTANTSNPAPSSSKPTPNSGSQAPSSGAVQKQVLPNASQGALHTIHGHIKIRVHDHVDASGNVTEAKLTSPGPSRYFARLSKEAAEQWKFTPATQNGQPAPSDWTIMFEWTRDGIQAFPQQNR